MLSLVFTLALATVAEPAGGDSDPSESVLRDCGPRCLFLLARLEGRKLAPADVSSALPGGRSRHYSLAELRSSASKIGLDLSGVRLSGGTSAPDRPALAFLKRGAHGHFVVVRPVGHSGNLVQVIDPNEKPVVVDAKVLYASPEWTGLALVPARGVPWLRVCGIVGLGTLGVWVISPWLSRWLVPERPRLM